MSELQIHIPFNIYSTCAVSSARRYLNLIEKQLVQAQADDQQDALDCYLKSANYDKIEHGIRLSEIDCYYDVDVRQTFYFTSVVYLYMIFEKFVFRHFGEFQNYLKGDPKLLEKSNKKLGLVKAAQSYFRDTAKLPIFSDDQWLQLLEISHVRNCIVHNAGIPLNSIRNRDSIYALEVRIWRGSL